MMHRLTDIVTIHIRL